MFNLKGLLLLVGILIVFATYYFFFSSKKNQRKGKIIKRPLKKFFSESLKETIRWTLFSLICLILLLFVVRFVVSLFSETAHQTTTSSVYVPKKKILGYIDVTLSGKYGDRVYLYQNFSRDAKFIFIDATVDYSVINKNGEKSFALAGQDASDQLGFSNGNIWLRFKGQNGRNGSLKIMMYY